jgi:hypothetical protein
MALRLAERLIQLLDEGSFTATYKYAVLIGLMDLCMEQTSATGSPPDMITTAQLAEKIIELYWPHCTPYGEHGVLRQNRQGAQAEIVKRIIRFRERLDVEPAASLPLSTARTDARTDAWEKLVQFVEWKLVEMPLPKLQALGGREERFLYEYSFPRHMENSAPLQAYWEGKQGTFDNRLNLLPGVGAALVALNGVLRPLVHRQWAMMIASINKLEEVLLEDFLFGAERISLDPVRPRLAQLQGRRCFYCGGTLDGKYEVDHFIPWSRYPDNGIFNLVVADARCNNRKRHYLAAAEHVESWRKRSERLADDLVNIALETSWESRPERTLGVARAIYCALPEGARLWQVNSDLIEIDRPRIVAALSA